MKRASSLQPWATSMRWLALCFASLLVTVTDVRADAPLDVREDTSTAPEAPQTPPAPADTRPSPLAFLLAGGGVTSRTLRVPANDGPRNLATGLAPALSIRIAARIQNAARFLSLRLSYQTSLGVHASETIPDASILPSDTHIRSHRFEGGLAPGLFFSPARDSVALSLFVGYGLRALASVAELRIPRFTLHGPVARLELDVPLFAGRLSLRLAPEVQLLVGMTQQLRALAGLSTTAFAIGGEASVRLQLGGPVAARLCYREAHARSTGLEGRAFEDIERYVTLELSLRTY